MLFELKHLDKHYGAFHALHDISGTIAENQVIGMVGINGAGKSTLCNIIAGNDTEFDGTRYTYPGTKISYFRQSLNDSNNNAKDKTVFEYVLESQAETLQTEQDYHDFLKKLEANPSDQKLLAEFGNVQEKYMNAECYNLIERIEETLIGLGIHEHGDGARNISWTSPIVGLSGGERKIVELATVLLNKDANLLILDEPTNHLDIEGRNWLENYIRGYKGSVLLVSHDRYVLNRLADAIWEIEDGTLAVYRGNYDKFEQLKKEKIETLTHSYDLQQKELARLEALLKELRRKLDMGGGPALVGQYNATKTRIARFKEDLIEHPLKNKKTLVFSLQKPPQFGHMVAKLDHFTFNYSDKRQIFDEASMLIINGERIALLGANGSGKSTLFKVLLSKYASDRMTDAKQFGIADFYAKFGDEIGRSSAVKVGPGIKVAYYSQTHSQLDESKTIRELLKDLGIKTEGEFQGYIKRFGFDKETVDFKKIADLSGGEKSKVQFMMVMMTEANVLLLDEPINHLDIESMKVVEQVLADYKGTIIVISHDRYFLNRVINKVVFIDNHKIYEFLGNYDEFLEKNREE